MQSSSVPWVLSTSICSAVVPHLLECAQHAQGSGPQAGPSEVTCCRTQCRSQPHLPGPRLKCVALEAGVQALLHCTLDVLI